MGSSRFSDAGLNSCARVSRSSDGVALATNERVSSIRVRCILDAVMSAGVKTLSWAASSGGVSRQFKGAMTSPALAQAKSNSTCSGRFSVRVAILSPGISPK